MKRQTITAAPQAYITDALYSQWLETHTGTKKDFIEFMSNPTALRTNFLSSMDPSVNITEGVGTATYNAQ